MKKERLGPSGDVPNTARHRALSAVSRVRMLELVRRADAGLTAAQVVEATGMHPSTVRAHLDQLAQSGLLVRHRRGDGSPGRPAWRYRAAPALDGDENRTGAGLLYRELAGALVAQLARDADDPHTAGVRAGREWGRSLAAPVSAAAPRTEPLDGLVRVLEQLGFTPEVVERPHPGTAVVHLRTCPFLDLALGNPDVVCGVHQGVIGGALGALGARAADSDLQPFAAPGACVVRVHAAASRVAGQDRSGEGPGR